MNGSAQVRHEFSKRTKLEAFKRANGKCENCGTPLRYGGFDYDHIIPDTFSGRNDLANARVLCRSCHRDKTSQVDIPAIAKSNRIRAKEAGIRKRSTFACSRASPFKKKIDGTVVRRNEQ